jgi:tetratricopeptide (TPR) repeat protein
MLKNKQIPVICILLAAAALMAFWQVNQCDFISMDDPLYVTDNIHVKSGITLGSIRWAFTTGHATNWHPVTWMFHMLDVQLFGLKPRWHHLTNLLFHIANALLLFRVLHRMTKAPWKSAFVAALFALHPLHVESVAWVAERKDVLSTFFWMLTMGAYTHYVEHRAEDGRRKTVGGGHPYSFLRPPSSVLRYLPVLIFFALGLMAKPMLVTLPFVLLLLDYWPLQRLEPEKSPEEIRTEASKQAERSADHKYQWAMVRPLLLEKIPLFALAALSSIVTFVAQQKGGAVASIEVFSLGVRIANALVSYIVYIGKTIWPINLAVFYPHPGLLPLWQVLWAGLLLIAVTILIIRTAKRFPYLTMGWLWFTGTLVPVIGIVQVGSQAMADRYTYIPLIGLFVMAAWGIPDLLKKWQPTRFPTPRKKALFASSALVLLSLFIVTWTQVGYWRNEIALYDHSLKVAGPSDIIHCNRGVAYFKRGDRRQAISDFDRAIQINPDDAQAYYNRGVVYGELRNMRQAISDYDRAIEIDPENADAYNNRGVAHYELGNHRQAISDYDRAIQINPEYAAAYNNRGVTYGELGNLSQAISDFDRAIEINPEYAAAYNSRGATYGKLGNLSQAIPDFDRAIEINRKYADAYYNRGIVYSELGNVRQAISDYDRAIEINPEYARAHYNRGAAYSKLGNYRRAIDDFDRAIQIDPEYAEAYNNLGAAYGKLGNYRQAISDFDRAIEINPEYARAYINRGAAYSELGNQEQAISDYERAIQIDPENADAYNNLGTAYNKLGNLNQAISVFDRAIKINPEYAAAYNNRGVLYDILGNNRQAIPDFDRAIEINPEYADAYNNRGVAYGKLGNPMQAISDFDRAIEINPEYAKAYYNRGVVYGMLRNQRQEIEDLQKAARLGSEDAKNSLRNRGTSW